MGIDTSMLKYGKPAPRVVGQRTKRLDAATKERLCREAVNKRDKGKCVVPGCKEHGPHKHHIVYRSRGGKWTTANVCSLCVAHHQLLHAGLIAISGNADEHLTITGEKKYLAFKL
jgi:hypothetical protein